MTAEIPYPIQQKLRKPHIGNIAMRHIIVEAYKFLAPAVLDEYGNTINETINLIEDGHALLVLGLHYSKSDGFDFAIRPHDIVRKIYGLPVVLPVAYHQYVENKKLLDLLTKMSATNTVPIVTQHTIEEGRNNFLPLAWNFPTYVHLMREIIDNQGIAGIAAQARREKKLEIEQAKNRTLETLLYAVAREKERERRRNNPESTKMSIEQMIRQFKVAVLLMPIEPLYKADYEKLYNGYGFFKKKRVQFGPVFPIDKLYDLRDKINSLLKTRWDEEKEVSQKNKMKKYVTLDEVIITILSFGADPEYNRISREEDFAQATLEILDLTEGIQDLVYG